MAESITINTVSMNTSLLVIFFVFMYIIILHENALDEDENTPFKPQNENRMMFCGSYLSF